MGDDNHLLNVVLAVEDTGSVHSCACEEDHHHDLRASKTVSIASSLSSLWQCHRDGFSKEAFMYVAAFLFTTVISTLSIIKLWTTTEVISTVNVWFVLLTLVLTPWFTSTIWKPRAV